jgi:hypothetical protein
MTLPTLTLRELWDFEYKNTGDMKIPNSSKRVAIQGARRPKVDEVILEKYGTDPDLVRKYSDSQSASGLCTPTAKGREMQKEC